MTEEELLKKYSCNSLSSFIDDYLTCEVAYDLLKSQFEEIERHLSIIKEVREIIREKARNNCWIDQYEANDILEILDKVVEEK